MTVEINDDPRAPVFFLSYARQRQLHRPAAPPQPINQHVKRLYRDVSEHLGQLVGAFPGEDPGFMDITMEAGDLWRPQLLEKASTCQVLICLISTPYLIRSEWCAMEWDLFTRRRVLSRDDGKPANAKAIIPILWAPYTVDVPAEIDEVNRFVPTDLCTPENVDLYQSQGLFGLMAAGDDAYRPIVWSLAMTVFRIHQRYWVEPLQLTGKETFRTAFGPRGA
ncbi:TIR domain-containing protein [Virgisporangium aurantiacum]|uniref:TIR domain-containing protein n=1 Tax=Virgisporangium aurantiacum TaxID=175570 RepID=A0A8J4E142_9ACTN|nr:TIR domain-containing protein [Virgisporangium aurantiacum]GIJ57373.1 hypothetical protein Vau01_048890 [Virgisporangium aurantiacum]